MPSTPLIVADGAIIETVERPLSERLVYGSALHNEVLRKLQNMYEAGKSHIDKRLTDWDRVDHSLRMYVSFDEAKRKADKSYDYNKKEAPFDNTIMIPFSYANLMSRQVQKFATLNASDPLIHLSGRGSEDYKGARLHEAIIKYDLEQFQAAIELWQLCFDDERYGFCVLNDSWEEEYGWVLTQPEIPQKYRFLLPEYDEALFRAGRKWDLKRQYYRWLAIDPRKYLPDPSVPICMPQSGGFCGHWSIVSWSKLKANEMPNGAYINVDVARKMKRMERLNENTGRDTTGDYGTKELNDDDGVFPTGELAPIQVKLIPREWELSSSERLETWHFAMWNQNVVVRAHPMPYIDEAFRYSVGQGDLDKHAPFTAGMGEQLQDTQRFINWLFGSHATNIQRHLNNSLVWDPSLFEAVDVLQPRPGRGIRLTKHGQTLSQRGFNIRNMYAQIEAKDVTGSHIEMAELLMKIGQTLSAASNPAQGQIFAEKRTLGEVDRATGSSSQRIGTAAQLIDLMAIATVARRHIIARQQFTSREQSVRITGELADRLGTDYVSISPDDLFGEYDYIPHTPTMAADPSRKAAVWGVVMQILASAPQLLAPGPDGQRIDPRKVFEEFVRANGVNYIDQFMVSDNPAGAMPRPQLVPDEVAANQLQAGNIVPMGAQV